MPRLTWLADALRDAGLIVVEHRGWQDHVRPGDWSPRYGLVHATAAPRTQPDATQVQVVRDGRSDLPGPIANATVDRQGRWHVLSAGRCNSTLPGTAGPYEGLGNTYALSTEACNDNRTEPWPDVQYRSYVRGWAAWCRRLGWTADRLVGHKEHTPGRKSDPTFDMGQFRRDVAAVLAGRDQEMPLTPEDLSQVRTQVALGLYDALHVAATGQPYRGLTYSGRGSVGAAIRANLAAIVALGSDTDEQVIISGVLASLTPAAIAAAIPDELARQVADEIAARLAS